MWLAALAFAVISHVLAAVVVARALGVPVAEFAVGLGPGLEIPLEPGEKPRLRFVFGGWVRFVDPDGVSPGQRLAMALAGVAPMLFAAGIVLGAGTFAELGAAFVDLGAAHSPFWLAHVALVEAYACLHTDPTRFAALLLVKIAAWNLLPLPYAGVGQALLALVPSQLVRERLTLAAALVTTIWFGLWGLAVVAWLAPSWGPILQLAG